MRFKDSTVADGKWHKVLISRSGNFVSMLIDDKYEVKGRAGGSHTNININSALEVLLGAQILAGMEFCLHLILPKL